MYFSEKNNYYNNQITQIKQTILIIGLHQFYLYNYIYNK